MNSSAAETRIVSSSWDEPAGCLMTGRAATGVEGAVESDTGFRVELRNQTPDAKGEAQAEKTARREYRCRGLGRTDLYQGVDGPVMGPGVVCGPARTAYGNWTPTAAPLLTVSAMPVRAIGAGFRVMKLRI